MKFIFDLEKIEKILKSMESHYKKPKILTGKKEFFGLMTEKITENRDG